MASIATGSALGALTLGWVSGCSVIYDLSTEQCSVDADCSALGGAFTGLVCVENLCQEPPITGCQSNAQCMDEQGGGLQPWACIERECVRLDSAECPTMLPQTQELWRANLRTANPLILAGTGVISGTTVLDTRLRNYDLAITELTNRNGGLPSGRQVVMLGCRATFDDDEGLNREMEHLANVVKVPGLISAFEAADLQRAFNEYGLAAQMFFMSPLQSDPALAALQDEGLIWHMGPASESIARVYAPLLTRTLAFLGVTSGAKVATVVTTDDRLLADMLPTVETTPERFGLSFNDKTVSQNRTDNNYRTVNVTSSASSDVSTQISAIVTMRPHVIISVADTQFVQRMIPAIEAQWPTDGTPKPFYLLSPDNFNDARVQDQVQSISGLYQRVAGVNFAAAADTHVYDEYVGRWLGAFPDFPEDVNYENFYDAAYYLLYAAAGARQNLTNGQSLLTGMNRLLAGPEYEVGPGQMPEAMGLVGQSNTNIELVGTLGPPDFNRTNGTRNAPGSVWCIDNSRAFRADVLRYEAGAGDDATQASLTGSFPCIADF